MPSSILDARYNLDARIILLEANSILHDVTSILQDARTILIDANLVHLDATSFLLTFATVNEISTFHLAPRNVLTKGATK